MQIKETLKKAFSMEEMSNNTTSPVATSKPQEHMNYLKKSRIVRKKRAKYNGSIDL